MGLLCIRFFFQGYWNWEQTRNGNNVSVVVELLRGGSNTFHAGIKSTHTGVIRSVQRLTVFCILCQFTAKNKAESIWYYVWIHTVDEINRMEIRYLKDVMSHLTSFFDPFHINLTTCWCFAIGQNHFWWPNKYDYYISRFFLSVSNRFAIPL